MHFTAFDGRAELANWLAAHVAQRLAKGLSERGRASLAVSGGSTPRLLFEQLSDKDIDWKNVWITLVDERWVPPGSNRSNQRLVTIELLGRKAANAHFVPLYREGLKPGDIGEIESEISSLMPFDVVILGMGADGHTASFFTGGSRLHEAVSPDTKALVIDMEAEGAGETRVTLTLPVIVASAELILHIEGQEKRDVLESADEDGVQSTYPISHVLTARPDIRVVWAA
jgi:6-phosphogluconolactonase